MKIKRLFVEKKQGLKSLNLLTDIVENLGIKTLESIRIVNRYDISGVDDQTYNIAKSTIFSEPNTDICFDEEINIDTKFSFTVEYLPGAYDARASFAKECIEIVAKNENTLVKTATLYLFYGNLSNNDMQKIKSYLINPVESRLAKLEKPTSLIDEVEEVLDVEILTGFCALTENNLQQFLSENSLAMTINDIKLVQQYFKTEEKREPTITEIKVIDTYWSDHCRHTTFMTKLDKIEIFDDYIKATFDDYIKTRELLGRTKDICLMDVATIGMKYLKSIGKLNDLDESDEINACSIKIKVDVDNKEQDYLLMFKNETHNHPTEIEPFGGAATCLGGAIRDPLSGRSYVYQAMRVTGSGDPREKIADTIKGKLPQRVITKKAADGYSSYGNQIGLATGGVYEIYDEGYKAKRMEVGAVIAATPAKNVIRKKPENNDVIILLGGKTGRDGIGGATGSSKEQTEESTTKSSSEVQKGNPVTERKIQRLFRDENVTKLIKKCNDFGAGGVCVAIGELADSLEINLDAVPKKYEGLNGTELAISESQERMAVVVCQNDAQKFIKYCENENIEATIVAKVTDNGRLIMKWRGKDIFNISRSFLDTNGAKAKTNVVINKSNLSFFNENNYKYSSNVEITKTILSDINICSKKGLVENFDSTIGAATVLMPFGGKTLLSEPCGMVAKIPVADGETQTCSIMTYGYNPKLTKLSTFHGGMYAVIESIAKIVALGADYSKTRLSLQEYFERMTDEASWGKPLSAILGALHCQLALKIPAIGGKDSMSGTFKDMKVPETLISFAVNYDKVYKILSPELKNCNSKLVLIEPKLDDNYIPDFEDLQKKYAKIYQIKPLSAKALTFGGILETAIKMSIGNKIGLEFKTDINLIKPRLGGLIIEVLDEKVLENIEYTVIANTNNSNDIIFNNGEKIAIDECIDLLEKPLESVFPSKTLDKGEVQNIAYTRGNIIKCSQKIAKPNVFIPVFPGTNCEYDTSKAFLNVNANVKTSVFKNLKPQDINDSIDEIVKHIKNSQIIAIPGGFSASDEPDGSAKFIASVFRNEKIKDAVHEMLYNRDGLMIGICNGFQALVKLGLLPFGEIQNLDENMPTLTFNKISRHISMMAKTKITSNKSPWLNGCQVGDVFDIPMSHGEGRFVASEEMLQTLILNGQIATQYVNEEGQATIDGQYNPNGSILAVEGICSVDGRILGKMGHSERIGNGLYKNIYGKFDQKIFESGVKYYL